MRIGIVIFVFLPLVILGQDSKKCSDFINGKFTYPLLEEGSGYEIREGENQTSYLNNGKKQLLWKVKWIDDCHYILTLDKIYGDNKNWSIGDIITVEINSFKNNCYGFKSIIKAKNYSDEVVAYDMLCKEDEM